MSSDLRGVRAVVVGTSAGGIEALTQLLRALPPSFPAAVIIVQHLPRARTSLLVELFTGKCSLPLSDATVHYSRPSIDVLFESAAEVYRNHLMGVVLTGANADGAEGLDAIRRNGGFTVVQDPQNAQYPAMPNAALALGPANFVVSLDALCALLLQVGQTQGPLSAKIETAS